MARLPVAEMRASISLKNRIGTHHGEVVDFNRLGITVALRRAIPVDKPLYVTLRHGATRLDAIVGAAHHCRFDANGWFRCGIRFRTNSPIQLDRDEIELKLLTLEQALAGAASTALT